jgi:hypothetical protein
MAEDPAARIAKWNTKYNTERIKATLDEMRPTMLQKVTAVFPMLTAMELQVKQVCDGAGVPTRDYPSYLAFGRELWSLGRKEISGESAAIEAKVLLDKWKARGLVEAVLQAIRTDVFNIAAPIGP